jgi:guanine nucleotide-binding protein G(I)/G(S)/G(T) subunit beta-1
VRSAASEEHISKLNTNMRARRRLKGHFGKIYALQWFSNSTHLVSASQDGKLIIWNAVTTAKSHAISMSTAWVMTCAAHPKDDRIVASAGLDHLVSIYRANDADYKGELVQELNGHTEWISQIRFTPDGKGMISVSGDKMAILWDVEKKEMVSEFHGHIGDLLSVSIDPENPNIFATSSCDTTVRLWDIRDPKSTGISILGHESDVNAVKWFPGGNAVGTASDDSTCHLMDIRKLHSVNVFYSESIISCAHTLDFSLSGRTMMVGYDDWNVLVWDTTYGVRTQSLQFHENRVSFLETSPDGEAAACSSWDHLMTIFG